jgi:hypothetical protein
MKKVSYVVVTLLIALALYLYLSQSDKSTEVFTGDNKLYSQEQELPIQSPTHNHVNVDLKEIDPQSLKAEQQPVLSLDERVKLAEEFGLIVHKEAENQIIDKNTVQLEGLYIEVDEELRERGYGDFAYELGDPISMMSSKDLNELVLSGDKNAIDEAIQRLDINMSESDYLKFNEIRLEIESLSETASETEMNKLYDKLHSFIGKHQYKDKKRLSENQKNLDEMHWLAALNGATVYLSNIHAEALDGDKAALYMVAVQQKIYSSQGLMGEYEDLKKQGEEIYHRLLKERAERGL